MRSTSRRWVLALALSPSAGIVWGCIGDDAAISSQPGSTPDAASDSPNASDAPANSDAPVDSPEDRTDAGHAGDAGPRCDPTKAFDAIELLQGISTADDEHGVWVSADELTAYVAVTPMNGSGSQIRKSTRSTRTANFSAPGTDPELVAINGGSFVVSTPSMTSNGLVFMAARDGSGATDDGVYVSIRSAVGQAFPAPVRSQSRANPISLGDAFLMAGGETLYLGQHNGTSYQVRAAPRDTAMTYGDGGFVDYSVAFEVDNINDDAAHDRRPVVARDGLTIVFSSNRAPASGVNLDLYIASRAGVAGVFQSPIRIAEPVNSTGSDLAGTISEDGCRLYLTSDRSGGLGRNDVYVAKRPL